MPLSLLAKRQSCVSRSTSEAEVDAVDTALRTLNCLVAMSLGDGFGSVRVNIRGDDGAMLQANEDGPQSDHATLGTHAQSARRMVE